MNLKGAWASTKKEFDVMMNHLMWNIKLKASKAGRAQPQIVDVYKVRMDLMRKVRIILLLADCNTYLGKIHVQKVQYNNFLH